MPDGLFANPLHWAILLVIVLIIFGPGKLPTVGSALGKSVREFKKATREEDEPTHGATTASPPMSLSAPASNPEVLCSSCGQENQGDALFCTKCGGSLERPVEAEPIEVPVGKAICETCGTENHRSSRFCAHCGKLLEASMSRA